MYDDIFINPEAVFVALSLIVFIVTMTVLNKSNIFPKGVRILVSIIIGLFSGYYLFKGDSTISYADESVFLLISFILFLLIFQFIFSKNEISGGKSFFLSLILSGLIVFILSRFDFVFTWFEGLQAIYITIIIVMVLVIVYMLSRKKYY